MSSIGFTVDQVVRSVRDVGGYFSISGYSSFSGSTTELRYFDDADNLSVLRGTGLIFTTANGVPTEVTAGTITVFGTIVDGELGFAANFLSLEAAIVFGLVLAGDSAGLGRLLLRDNNTLFLSDLSDRINAAAGNDLLFGALGNDELSGGNGDDTLSGGLGIDTLTGGRGADKFEFDQAIAEADTITDLSAARDIIALDRDIFLQTGANGQLAAGFFAIGAAQDGNDRIIYDRVGGKLIYDADGDGAGEGVVFANVDARLRLDASNFLVEA